MDKLLEMLEVRLTPIVFITVLLLCMIASFFSKELKELILNIIKHKRTRTPALVCIVLIAFIIVTCCCYTFELWIQIVFLVTTFLLCIFPFLSPYIVSPVFFIYFSFYRKKRRKAPELIDKYASIKKFAILTRDKYLYACKLEEYCEVVMNYRLAYSYFVTVSTKKLYGKEMSTFNGRYGEILVMLGSIKTGIKYLQESNDIVAEDRLAFAYEQMGRYDEALKIMTKLKDEAETKNYDNDIKAMILNDYARIFALTNELSQSLSYYNEALKYASMGNSKSSVCLIYSNLIANLYRNNDNVTANRYYNEFLEFLSKIEDSTFKVLELNNIKMLRGRYLQDIKLIIESINGIEEYLDKAPDNKRVHFLTQLIDIKAEFKIDILENVSELIKIRATIKHLDVPTRFDLFTRLERVTKEIVTYSHPDLTTLKNVVDDYFENQISIDASNYSEELPSVCVVEKNFWMLIKYIFMFRNNKISFKEFNKRYLEIIDVMDELALDYQKIDIRMMFIHELFSPKNVEDVNKPYSKSVYHDCAVKEVKEVLDYVFTTPYKVKTIGLISLLYIYTLSCELYKELDKLGEFIKDHSSLFRTSIRFDLENLNAAMQYYNVVIKKKK